MGWGICFICVSLHALFRAMKGISIVVIGKRGLGKKGPRKKGFDGFCKIEKTKGIKCQHTQQSMTIHMVYFIFCMNKRENNI